LVYKIRKETFVFILCVKKSVVFQIEKMSHKNTVIEQLAMLG